MTDIMPAVVRDRKSFLKSLAEEGDSFLENLRCSLEKKGFPISRRDIKGVYTVSTQLFHRLWWDNSENRNERYKDSFQGTSYLDLLLRYRSLRKFPTCLTGICEILRCKLVMQAHETCEITGVRTNDDLVEMREVIGDILSADFSGIDILIASISSIKKDSRSAIHKECREDKWVMKRDLKQDSIQKILFPIIWSNLIRDFVDHPCDFVRFE